MGYVALPIFIVINIIVNVSKMAGGKMAGEAMLAVKIGPLLYSHKNWKISVFGVATCNACINQALTF